MELVWSERDSSGVGFRVHSLPPPPHPLPHRLGHGEPRGAKTQCPPGTFSRIPLPLHPWGVEGVLSRLPLAVPPLPPHLPPPHLTRRALPRARTLPRLLQVPKPLPHLLPHLLLPPPPPPALHTHFPREALRRMKVERPASSRRLLRLRHEPAVHRHHSLHHPPLPPPHHTCLRAPLLVPPSRAVGRAVCTQEPCGGH